MVSLSIRTNKYIHSKKHKTDLYKIKNHILQKRGTGDPEIH